MAKQKIEIHNGIRYWSDETETFSIKFAEGDLGPANKTKRDRIEHEKVSKGTGDDAGHLIARKYGGVDLPCNFGRQNWKQNRGGGTYYQTETLWNRCLSEGAKVHVIVAEKTRRGENRAFYRSVKWTITNKGKSESGSIEFLNSESERMRQAAGIVSEQYDQPADVIDLFTRKRL